MPRLFALMAAMHKHNYQEDQRYSICLNCSSFPASSDNHDDGDLSPSATNCDWHQCDDYISHGTTLPDLCSPFLLISSQQQSHLCWQGPIPHPPSTVPSSSCARHQIKLQQKDGFCLFIWLFNQMEIVQIMRKSSRQQKELEELQILVAFARLQVLMLVLFILRNVTSLGCGQKY